MDAAFDAFADTVRVIEQIMAFDEDTFEIGCSSPALQGFVLQCQIHWLEKDGREYKEISMQHKDWWNWIVPLDYQNALRNHWFDAMRADRRFDTLFDRLNKCVISRSR